MHQNQQFTSGAAEAAAAAAYLHQRHHQLYHQHANFAHYNQHQSESQAHQWAAQQQQQVAAVYQHQHHHHHHHAQQHNQTSYSANQYEPMTAATEHNSEVFDPYQYSGSEIYAQYQSSEAPSHNHQVRHQPQAAAAAAQYSGSPPSQFKSSSSSSSSSAHTSAMDQLQAFALSTPEAAVAAAAAAAVSFPQFYSGSSASGAASQHHPVSMINPLLSHQITRVSIADSTPKPSARSQKQRAPPKAKSSIKRQANSDTSDATPRVASAATSRYQRRYAGRASCDCPNCLDLERLRRLGIEPPADTTNGQEQLGPNGKKLMHVCHHAGCGKEYEKTSHLRAHLRWHTSERQSTCKQQNCGKRFNRADELRKHMSEAHPNHSVNKVVIVKKEPADSNKK